MKQIKFQENRISKAVVDKILVEEGQEVNAKDTLAIILTRDKAIKISAPTKCLIYKILISSSDIIENNEVLFEVEEINEKDSSNDISSRLLAREQTLENRRNTKSINNKSSLSKEELLIKLAEREKSLDQLNNKPDVTNLNAKDKIGKTELDQINDENDQDKLLISKKQKSMLSNSYDFFNISKETELDQNLLANFINNLGTANNKKIIKEILSEKKSNIADKYKPIKLSPNFSNLPITWNFVSVKVDIFELINLLTIVKTKNSKTLDLKALPFYLLAVSKALTNFPYFNSYINENALTFNWQINIATELLINDNKADVVFKNVNNLSSRELILEVDNAFEKPENYKNSSDNNNILKILTCNSLQFTEALLLPSNSMLSQINFGAIQKEPLVSATAQDLVIHDTVLINLAYRTAFFSNELVSKFINYLAFLISKPALLM